MNLINDPINGSMIPLLVDDLIQLALALWPIITRQCTMTLSSYLISEMKFSHLPKAGSPLHNAIETECVALHASLTHSARLIQALRCGNSELPCDCPGTAALPCAICRQLFTHRINSLPLLWRHSLKHQQEAVGNRLDSNRLDIIAVF